MVWSVKLSAAGADSSFGFRETLYLGRESWATTQVPVLNRVEQLKGSRDRSSDGLWNRLYILIKQMLYIFQQTSVHAKTFPYGATVKTIKWCLLVYLKDSIITTHVLELEGLWLFLGTASLHHMYLQRLEKISGCSFY